MFIKNTDRRGNLTLTVWNSAEAGEAQPASWDQGPCLLLAGQASSPGCPDTPLSFCGDVPPAPTWASQQSLIFCFFLKVNRVLQVFKLRHSQAMPGSIFASQV